MRPDVGGAFASDSADGYGKAPSSEELTAGVVPHSA